MERPLALLVAALVLSAAASPAAGGAEVRYRWVIMVYMDGDNNLEGAAITDFNEMERAGSTGDVAIVVLLDRAPGYDSSNGDWTEARIYLVEHDEDPVTIRSTMLKNLGEVNMGDPETLVSFVSYVASNFPADRYALIIWDHGNAWRSPSRAPETRGVAWDETSGDYLTQMELLEALEAIKARVGPLDLLGFDACLMGMVEIAFDIAKGGYASVLVASQDYEPLTGWYYTPFLRDLAADPDMDAAGLASRIVDAYAYYYSTIVPTGYATLTAVDLQAILAAASSLRYAAYTMTLALASNSSLALEVMRARDGVEATGDGYFPDLISLLDALRSGVEWSPAYDPRGALGDAIFGFNRSVIAFWAAAGHSGLTGLSIYMPPSVDAYLRERHVYLRQTLFSSDAGWAAFLDEYFSAFTPGGSLEVSVAAPAFTAPGDSVLVLVTYAGTPVDPDYVKAELSIDGSWLELNLSRLATGLYTAPLPRVEGNGTAFIVARAYYWDLAAVGAAVTRLGGLESLMPLVDERLREITGLLEDINASLAYVGNGVFELRIGQDTILARLAEVRGGVAVLKAGLANLTVRIDAIEDTLAGNTRALQDLVESLGGEAISLLRALNASITALHGRVAEVNTSVGRVLIDLEKLGARVEVIGDNVVRLETALGGVNGTLLEIKNGLAYINTSIGRAVAEASAAKAYASEAASKTDEAARKLEARITMAIVLAAASAALSAATLAYVVVKSRSRRPERRVEIF